MQNHRTISKDKSKKNKDPKGKELIFVGYSNHLTFTTFFNTKANYGILNRDVKLKVKKRFYLF